MKRQNLTGDAPWEKRFGYSRAVSVGDQIYVAGTTATDSGGEIVGEGDAAAQARQALRNIAVALERAGSRLEDVVRTRIYLTDIADAEAVGLVHGDVFASIRPASTMVEVRRLVDPRMLVEIEADALVISSAL
jgi:enamine deaminase RidA (YjgF/YER057c/UK114 family)